MDKNNFTKFWQKLSDSIQYQFQINLKELYNEFAKKLNFSIKDIKHRPKYSVCYYDMSELRIEVGNATPFYFIQAPVTEIDDIFYQIKTSIYKKNLQENINFICYNGNDFRLRELIVNSYLDLVVLDRSDIYKILFTEHHRRILIKIMIEQHGISVLSPFSHTRIPVGSMFYGRKEEMQKIIRSRFNLNFAIIGSRRIGKSTLLFNIKNYLDQEKYFHTIFLDCYRIRTASDFVQQVIAKLEPRLSVRVQISTFYDVMKKVRSILKTKIILIIDEIDELLEYDKSCDWQLSRTFHTLASEDICKIIIAGYRKLYKETNNQHSPLFKYFEPVILKELDDTSAKQLILEPLDDIGLKIKNRSDFASKIIYLTASHPQFIQFLCGLLVNKVNQKNKQEISLSDLKEIENSSEYHHFVVDTLIMNTDSFQQLIVYKMVNHKKFTLEDVLAILKDKHGIDLSLTSTERDCYELELANIIKRDGEFYKFAYPALPEILSTQYDLKFKINRLVEEILSERKYYA